jgi:hypothetical protein
MLERQAMEGGVDCARVEMMKERERQDKRRRGRCGQESLIIYTLLDVDDGDEYNDNGAENGSVTVPWVLLILMTMTTTTTTTTEQARRGATQGRFMTSFAALGIADGGTELFSTRDL